MRRRSTVQVLSTTLTLLLMKEEQVCTVCVANGNPMTVENLDLWSIYEGKKH